MDKNWDENIELSDDLKKTILKLENKFPILVKNRNEFLSSKANLDSSEIIASFKTKNSPITIIEEYLTDIKEYKTKFNEYKITLNKLKKKPDITSRQNEEINLVEATLAKIHEYVLLDEKKKLIEYISMSEKYIESQKSVKYQTEIEKIFGVLEGVNKDDTKLKLDSLTMDLEDLKGLYKFKNFFKIKLTKTEKMLITLAIVFFVAILGVLIWLMLI